MDTQRHRFWAHCITLATAILFGLSVWMAPPAVAGSKGKAKGHDKSWKQEKEDGNQYRKKHREMEREEHRYGREQEHGARETERKREMKERQYGQDGDREDDRYSQRQGQERTAGDPAQED